jgi:DNA-binding transcriptional MerR regulator
MSEAEASQVKPTYRIGAVSRLTGVASDTLRVWERRYRAVVPQRSDAGTRLYSQEDVGRLALIKRLVDGGDAISSVANLGLEQLRERATGAPPQPQVQRPCRVAVLGSTLPDRLAGDAARDDKLELVGLYRDREDFLAQVPGLQVDLVVLEYPTIQREQVREIGTLLLRTHAHRAIVVYGFAARSTLDRLGSPRITPIRAPIDRAELRRLCLLLLVRAPAPATPSVDSAVDISRPLPARRFDDVTLARIAAASVTIRCECPHHLVDLVSSLTAFEAYSRECEVLNGDDAALHAFLHAATAQARSLLEDALARVVEADGIRI